MAKIPMLRFLCCALMLCGMSASAWSAERIGLAESDGSFEILRVDDTRDSRAGILTAVELGDILTARTDVTRFESTRGATLLLTEGASVSFPTLAEIDLRAGQVAVALPEGSGQTIAVQDLRIAPDPAAGGSANIHIASIEVRQTGQILIGGVAGALLVTDEAGNAVASLTRVETLRLVESPEGWKVFSPRTGSPEVFSQFGDELEVSETGEEDDEEGRRAAILLLAAGGGAAAAAGGGYWVYKEIERHEDRKHRRDKNDREEESKPPTSPVDPGDDDQQ